VATLIRNAANEPVARWWEAMPEGIARIDDSTELDHQHRLKVLATAAGDRLLRSGLGLVISGAMLPRLLTRQQFDRERERLRFYWRYADAADAGQTFVRPPQGVPVRELSPRRWEFRPRGVHSQYLAFDSPFTPLHPELLRSYGRYRSNRRAHALHYRHPDGPRPTVIYLHGYSLPSYRVNSAWFSLPWLYKKGYDVLQVTLPFHGVRKEANHPYSGYGFFADGFAHLNEAILQAVYDVRIWMDYLLARGAPRVGVTGLSLGGYITSVLAAADARPAFIIPNSPVVSLFDMARVWVPSGPLLDFARWRSGASLTELRHGVALHSPLSYPSQVAAGRQLIIGGAGDRLTSPHFVRLLHQHWQGSDLHWFPGNHVLHLQQVDYLRRMKRLMDQCTVEA
jgi:acetyl esterase/lipase